MGLSGSRMWLINWDVVFAGNLRSNDSWVYRRSRNGSFSRWKATSWWHVPIVLP